MREDLKSLLDETIPEDVTLTEAKKEQILLAVQERNRVRKPVHVPKFIPALIGVALIGLSGLWAYPYLTQEDLPQEIQGGEKNQTPAEENTELPMVEDEDSEEKIEPPQVEDEISNENSESPSVENENEDEKLEEANDDKPEDSAANKTIDMPFKIGEHLNKLINEYGEPIYDDYIMGSRLVSFEGKERYLKERYFLNEAGIITGYMISSPDISIYGAHIGMTFSEIASILSDPVGMNFDGAETQDYVTLYYIEGYKIFFHSETETGPTTFVMISQHN